MLPKHFSIITAQNPQTNPSNKGGNEALETALKQKGYHYEKVLGKYEDPNKTEEGFLIHNPDEKHIQKLGEEFGQGSVLHSKNGQHKLYYTSGENKGQHHKGSGTTIHSVEPKNYYSTIYRNNKPVHFSLNFNLNDLHKADPILDKLDLLKGAMQRLAPFNPQKDVTPDQKFEGQRWQESELEGDRSQIPRMAGNMRTRALHKLHGSTQVRRAKDGGREFLLHRGMSSNEYNKKVKDKTNINHTIRSSWTPNRAVASNIIMGNPGSKVASAWIHEKNIVHIPKQLGAVENYNPSTGLSPYKPPKGPNRFAPEHEVIVEAGHNSQRHTTPVSAGLPRRFKLNKSELRKEVFPGGQSEAHGWISPTGKFHKLDPHVNHGKWIRQNHKLDTYDAYHKGWLAIGKAGFYNITGHDGYLMNPSHPATVRARQLAGDHFGEETQLSTQTRTVNAPTHRWSKHGTIPEGPETGYYKDIKKNTDEYEVKPDPTVYSGMRAVYAYHKGRKIGHVFYADAPDSNGWHNVRNANVETEHRRKGVYTKLLHAAKEEVQSRGSKGLKSQGYQRSSFSNKVWEKIHTDKKENKSVYPEYPDVDYFLKNNDLQKMALVFDHKRDKKPHTTVWRMEDKEGRGPYHSEKAQDVTWSNYASRRQPTPGEDRGFHREEIEPSISVAEVFEGKPPVVKSPYAGKKFGFKSKEQAEKWFTPEETHQLKQRGFELRPKKAKKVWAGTHQVYYEPHEDEIKKAAFPSEQKEAHGWIDPKGKYFHLAPYHSHFHDSGHIFPKGIDAYNAHRNGWLSIGHGGGHVIGGSDKVLSNPNHPAVITSRKLAGKYFGHDTHIDSKDTGLRVVSTEHWIKHGTIPKKGSVADFRKNDPINNVYSFEDVQIMIEWPKGSVRKYTDGYEKEMKCDYGYILGTKGDDGEEEDVYVGDNKASKKIFLIEQNDSKGGEDKIMFGFNSSEEAKLMYLAHMELKNFKSIREITLDNVRQMIQKKGFKLGQGDQRGEEGKKYIVNPGMEKGLKGDWEKEGYKIKYRKGTATHIPGKTRVKHSIKAYDKNGNEVGEVSFYEHHKPGYLVSGGIYINEDHRRKGLGTSMYQLAEQKVGKKIVPSEHILEEGEKFWAQPERPFGKSILEKLQTLKKAISMPTIFIIRHGETAYNQNGHERLRGWSDIPLDEKGKLEAVRIGQDLKGIGIQKIYCSDLIRTQETANLIVKEFEDQTPIIPNDKFRPWNLGEYQGQLVEDIKDKILYLQKHKDEAPKAGECFNHFLKRFEEGLKDVMKQCQDKGETIAIVAHYRNLIITEAMFKAGFDLKNIADSDLAHKDLHTGAVLKLEWLTDHWKLSSIE